MKQAVSTNLGFPRIGSKRELKFALEKFWRGQISEAQLMEQADQLKLQHWRIQQTAGIDLIPVGDFSLYDHVLDTAVLFGAIPKQYQQVNWETDLACYFAMARGTSEHGGLPAMEMTKWFNTNYHYLVPQWEVEQTFSLRSKTLIADIQLAQSEGVNPRPVILGPVSFLLLGKPKSDKVDLSYVFESLLPVYEQLFSELISHGIKQIQIEEPCLVQSLSPWQQDCIKKAYQTFTQSFPELEICLTSYFDDLGENLELACSLPVDCIHLDLVAAPHQLEEALKLICEEQSLSLGVVNGRNVWINDLQKTLKLIQPAVEQLGHSRIQIAPSCSMLHVPIDLELEDQLDPEVKASLSFAKQKVEEISIITQAVNQGSKSIEVELTRNISAIESRKNSTKNLKSEVQQKMDQIKPEMFDRKHSFKDRYEKQQAVFQLPLLPTTTIGSFPQSQELRNVRKDFRTGKISEADYENFLKQQTTACIKQQEEIGLDVLVHGEFERNDMVEYFGEQLDGVTSTQFAWVQSYGSRCVKPPIIYGDVSRKAAMTVKWSQFAQQQTEKVVKGMLTGPVTILCWSFVRDDQPLKITCQQISLAIREEVKDLEEAGISMIQVDEPAFREGLPLKQEDWGDYLQWAVDCFRLATCAVKDETQIHTHMCYSEFNDIFPAIAALDADVISIETSRSEMELLEGFGEFAYPNAIGPGVYDIHSPRVPAVSEMTHLLEKAAQVLPLDRLWVNPDCGLKTRKWPETIGALTVMVKATKQLREKALATSSS